MRKAIVLFLAVLLSVGAYAADNNTTAGSDSQALTKKEQRRTMRGYKGFVEIASLTCVTFDDAEIIGEFSTSHGYQFNNFFYMGGGTGVDIYSGYGALVPFFGNIRINFLNKKITPVVDAKIGYSIGRFSGTYFSATFGLRFSIVGKKAVYALGELLSVQWDDRYHANDCGKIGLRVGYEF